MQKHWIEAAMKEHRRVAVAMGGVAAEVNPGENVPIICPAYVREPGANSGIWWVDVEVVASGAYMSQMYREDEILGLWSETKPVPHG